MEGWVSRNNTVVCCIEPKSDISFQELQDKIFSEETRRLYGKVCRFQFGTRVLYLLNDFALSKDMFNRDSCSYRDNKARSKFVHTLFSMRFNVNPFPTVVDESREGL